MNYDRAIKLALAALNTAFQEANRSLPAPSPWQMLRGYDPVEYQRRKWRERMRKLNRATLLVEGCRPKRARKA